MGPTSIMKPARMLPTWFEIKSCHNWCRWRISPMRSCLSQLPQSAPPMVWQRYQRNNQCHPGPDFTYIVMRKKNGENKPCCRGSWRRQWSNPIPRLEVEEGHLVLLSSAGTLLAEKQQIEVFEVEVLFYTHSGIWAFLWLQNRLTRDIMNWFLPAASPPPRSSYPSSSLPLPHHPSSSPSFPLSAFKQTARTDPTGSGINFRVTSTAYAFLNSSCYIKSKSASNLTPGVVVQGWHKYLCVPKKKPQAV